MILHEQQCLSSQQAEDLMLDVGMPAMPASCLGLNYSDGSFWSSYYVGVCRIQHQEVVVLPKRNNIDFLTLFANALAYEPSAEDFSSYYGIDWESEATANAGLYEVLTPLLVMHYLAVLNKLVQAGLRRGYVTREQNLRGRIKGRVMPIAHWRQNVLPKREDRFMCHYQEWTDDIPVNRLLKKALDYSLAQLNTVQARSVDLQTHRILALQRPLKEAFIGVSSEVLIQEVKTDKGSKLNKYYSQALHLARQILCHRENNISNNTTRDKVPMFWIDMSRLFEVYALQRMRDVYGDDILYQQKGSFSTVCDYLHVTERIVIDAKYKYWYEGDLLAHHRAVVEDLREISGYARDMRLRARMADGEGEPKCVIVYPSEQHDSIFSAPMSAMLSGHKIAEFADFYMLPIMMPRIH